MVIISVHEGTLAMNPKKKHPTLPNTHFFARSVIEVGMYLLVNGMYSLDRYYKII